VRKLDKSLEVSTMHSKINWPQGKSFAFTIFDDTDRSTLENARPVYDFLADIGIFTTKSVWPVTGADEPMVVGGSTCDDQEYLKWLQHLQTKGFEIGWHNAAYHSSTREITKLGLERFSQYFGHYPRAMANHTTCEEGIYWGPNRLSGIHRTFYNLLNRNRTKDRYTGHIPNSKFYWGDLCKEHIRYCRNFVFPDINTLKACPLMPYYDPDRPYVNGWYASSEGGSLVPFNKTLNANSQDRLQSEGGACVMYTHFGKGFFSNGKLDPTFRSQMERLAKKPGWFVPLTPLLDFLKTQNAGHVLTDRERVQLERKWLLHKFRVGTS
jgi:hypothetical protein